MSVNPISSNIINLLADSPITNKETATGVENSGSFADIFTDAMNNVVDTETVSSTGTVELLSGQSDDMSGLLLDAQKAEIALNLALQLRNKAIDAYNEIMRMQV